MTAKTTKQAEATLLRSVLVLGGLVFLLFCMTLVSRYIDLTPYIEGMRQWVETQGLLGALSFIMIYCLAIVLMVPASPFSILAGTLYGSIWGSVCVSIAATIGACLAFWISRKLARPTVVKAFSQSLRFRRLEQLTRQHGVWIVVATRLVPLFPFNLLNYGFGLTNISFKAYAFWSWLCMIPGIVMYVAGADVVVHIAQSGEFPFLKILGLVALVIALSIGGWVLKKKINLDQ